MTTLVAKKEPITKSVPPCFWFDHLSDVAHMKLDTDCTCLITGLDFAKSIIVNQVFSSCFLYKKHSYLYKLFLNFIFMGLKYCKFFFFGRVTLMREKDYTIIEQQKMLTILVFILVTHTGEVIILSPSHDQIYASLELPVNDELAKQSENNSPTQNDGVSIQVNCMSVVSYSSKDPALQRCIVISIGIEVNL